MPSMKCGGQRTTSGISTHRPSCLRQDLLFAAAYCQTSWSLSVCGSPACTPNLAGGTQVLQTAPSWAWVLGSEFRPSWPCGECFAHWAISPAQIFGSGQDHFQPTVSRYSWVHHCNHLVLVLYGKCESKCGGINWWSIILLGKAPSLGAWTC